MHKSGTYDADFCCVINQNERWCSDQLWLHTAVPRHLHLMSFNNPIPASPPFPSCITVAQQVLAVQTPDGKTAAVWVGNLCSAAGSWAVDEGIACIINCCEIEYEYQQAHPDDRWLNLRFLGRAWKGRMLKSIEVVLKNLCRGNKVLLHCKRGKHRSGAFAALIIALVLGISMEDALPCYFHHRGLSETHDQMRCRDAAEKSGLEDFLERFRAQRELPGCMDSVEALTVLLPLGTFKHRGSSSSSSSTVPPQNTGSLPLYKKRPTSRMPIGLTSKCMPVPKMQSGTGSAQVSGVRGPPPVAEPPPPPSSSTQASGVQGPAPIAGPPRPLSAARSRSRSSSASRHLVAEGVWECPQCYNVNAKSRLFCTSCQARQGLVQRWMPDDWMCEVCGNHNFAWRTKCTFRGCPSTGPKHLRGDWICPTCGNHNYASREFCNRHRCNQAKPGM